MSGAGGMYGLESEGHWYPKDAAVDQSTILLRQCKHDVVS